MIKGSKVEHWTKKEINVLRKFYFNYGPKHCASLINRSYLSVKYKAMSLKLQFNNKIARGSLLPKKTIIKKISNTEIISKCKLHGETLHYYSRNEIGGCKKCVKILQSNYPITEQKWKNSYNKFVENKYVFGI